jgi:hypothetical protein
MSNPTSAAEARAYCRTYLKKTATLESGTPPACFSAILPAALDCDPRTGQTSGVNWKDYLQCDSTYRIADSAVAVNATDSTYIIRDIGGTEVFAVRETLSVEFTDEDMEEILDELLGLVDWEDPLLYDDAHNCHIGYRYDDAGDLVTFSAEADDSILLTCGEWPDQDGMKLLQWPVSGVAFYMAQNWVYPYGVVVDTHIAATYWSDYADAEMKDPGKYNAWTCGAKWLMHSRDMREKRSTRTLAFDTMMPPVWWFDPDCLDATTVSYVWVDTSNYTFGLATDSSPTSCATGDWTFDAPDGGTLGYPLSAFTVVARGTLAADLGY